MDGSIYKFLFPESTEPPVQALLANCSFPPYCLGWFVRSLLFAFSALLLFSASDTSCGGM